jgi:hypothetical protein
MKFKVGQVLNSKGNGFFGRLIRYRNSIVYDSKHSWTHSAIITEVREDKVLVHEALKQGFVANYYEKQWLEKKIDEGHYVIGETKIELEDVLTNVRKYEGREYGFFDIFNIIFYWIFGSEVKFFFTGAQNLICSEAVARILYDSSDKKIDFEKEFLIPFDLIEPMFLWQSNQIYWYEKEEDLK